MGHQFSSALTQTNRLYEMPLAQYGLKDRINSALSIWKNKSIPFDELLQYRTVVNSQQQVRKIYDIFRLRHNHMFLPATKYLTCQQQGIKGCGEYYKGNIYLETSIATLSIINDIPFYDSLHIYAVAFKGFEILFHKFGYFDVFQDMFHICDNGRLKVWCNSQLYKLSPQTYLLDSNGRQQDMLYRIINIIDQNIDKTEHKNLKKYLYQRLPAHKHISSFDQANILFREICKQNNWQPPERLKCINQLSREDIQRLLIQQQAVHNESKENLTQLQSMSAIKNYGIGSEQHGYGRNGVGGVGEGSTSIRVGDVGRYGGNSLKETEGNNNGVSLINLNHNDGFISKQTQIKNYSMPAIFNPQPEVINLPPQYTSGRMKKQERRNQIQVISTRPSIRFSSLDGKTTNLLHHNNSRTFLPPPQPIKFVQPPKPIPKQIVKIQRNKISQIAPVESRLKPIVITASQRIPTTLNNNVSSTNFFQKNNQHIQNIHRNIENSTPVNVKPVGQSINFQYQDLRPISSIDFKPRNYKLQDRNLLANQIQYVQSERFKFGSPHKSMEKSSSKHREIEDQFYFQHDQSRQNKILKSLVIPDLTISHRQQKYQKILNGQNKAQMNLGDKNLTYKQAITQKYYQSFELTKKSASNFEERFEQSQETKKSFPFEQQSQRQKSKQTQGTNIFSLPTLGKIPTRQGAQYTDPKLMQMLSSRDFSKITINPTFNVTVNQEALVRGSISNSNSNSYSNPISNSISISGQQKSGDGSQLFFSFSNMKNRENRTKPAVDEKRGDLQLTQIKSYLDRVKLKYHNNEKQSDWSRQGKIEQSVKVDGTNNFGSSQNLDYNNNKKRYEASIDKQIWQDLVELRKNKNYTE